MFESFYLSWNWCPSCLFRVAFSSLLANGAKPDSLLWLKLVSIDAIARFFSPRLIVCLAKVGCILAMTTGCSRSGSANTRII